MKETDFKLAGCSIGLGVSTLTICFFPIIGASLSIIGVLLGIIGIKKSDKLSSILGSIICILGVILSIYVEILARQNQPHPLRNMLYVIIALLGIILLCGIISLIVSERLENDILYKLGRVMIISSFLNMVLIISVIIPLFGFINAI